ncbi:MAG: hypothetical protein N3F03_04340 [Ignavibacteria bacterium]|nr:hypothetical protein [Ignavibacteria bacterium]
MKSKFRSRINFVVLIIIFFLSLYEISWSQEIKLKKSEWKETIENLRLREQSLIREKEYLEKFILENKNLDSLYKLLEECKRDTSRKEMNDTIGYKLKKLNGNLSNIEGRRVGNIFWND